MKHQENCPKEMQCPKCGYYCLGKGGHGCIDKTTSPCTCQPNNGVIPMAEEGLKEWSKDWDLDTLVSNLVSAGMEYMAEKSTTKQLQENKRIIKEEIERRIAQGRQQGLREAMECVPEKDSTCCVMCDETRASLTELLEK